MSDTPYKDARANGDKVIGDTDGPRVPTQAEVDQEERDLKTAAVLFAEKVIVFSGAVQTRLDDLAVSWGYDSIISLCSYAGDGNQRYAAEGAAGKTGRSEAWEYCEVELEKIRLGERPEPESVEVFILELPPIVRP